MSLLIADYRDERAFFGRLLVADARHRILFFRGDSGTGKTTLLRVCLNDAIENGRGVVIVPVEFREEAVSVAEIFYRIGSKAGWNYFPRFTGTVDRLQEPISVKVGRNLQFGMNQKIEVALVGSKAEDVDIRMATLTNAWFEDVREFPGRLLLIFDTYEKALTSVQRWVEGPFLTRLADTLQLRILIAGQKVPDSNTIEWGHCCRAQVLTGVHEPEHWMPILTALNRRAPTPDSHGFIAGICHALSGRPDAIMQIIEGLPRSS